MLEIRLTGLALLLAISGCGPVSGDTPADASAPVPTGNGNDAEAGADGGKGEVVTGTVSDDKLTEEHGVFVTPRGSDAGDGTRARPFATVQTAITRGARDGKNVFVCTGTYAEAILVADSISILGGLDCTDPLHWKTGAAPSRIAAPTSPAITAKAITSPTRLEGLDVVAPNASAPGASSVGVFADHAGSLTIAKSKVAAGNGAPGTDGAAAIQLAPASSPDGDPSTASGACGGPFNVCHNFGSAVYVPTLGAAGASGKCVGADNHNGGDGGRGGNGGLWQDEEVNVLKSYYAWVVFNGLNGGVGGDSGSGSGAEGAPGNDGAPASDLGALTPDGYVPANGNPGTDGLGGGGGRGGTGGSSLDMPAASPTAAGVIWHGPGGAGGGAGGCPGLAGGAGTGGGASLGVALLESPVTLEDVAISSSNGGAAGRGSFGSTPTVGGKAGTNNTIAAGAGAGANGGRPGISTNGSNGPSIGVLASGSAPTMTGSTKATAGTGGPAIPGLTIYMLGFPRTLPGTPAGLSVDVKIL